MPNNSPSWAGTAIPDQSSLSLITIVADGFALFRRHLLTNYLKSTNRR